MIGFLGLLGLLLLIAGIYIAWIQKDNKGNLVLIGAIFCQALSEIMTQRWGSLVLSVIIMGVFWWLYSENEKQP